jgi:hypothetical protein
MALLWRPTVVRKPFSYGCIITHSQIKPPSRAYNAFQFEEPRLGEIGNVGKDGARLDEVKIVVLERQMRAACVRDEFERRAEMLLAPDDETAQYVHAPDFSCSPVRAKS